MFCCYLYCVLKSEGDLICRQHLKAQIEEALRMQAEEARGVGCALEKEVPGIDREGAPSQGRACDGGGNW